MLAEIAEKYPELDRDSFRIEHGYDDLHKKFSGENMLFIARDADKPCACVALESVRAERHSGQSTLGARARGAIVEEICDG
jgi:hypothetical protein